MKIVLRSTGDFFLKRSFFILFVEEKRKRKHGCECNNTVKNFQKSQAFQISVSVFIKLDIFKINISNKYSNKENSINKSFYLSVNIIFGHSIKQDGFQRFSSHLPVHWSVTYTFLWDCHDRGKISGINQEVISQFPLHPHALASLHIFTE